MISFLKRQKISLALLILSSIIGLFIYLKVSSLAVWRIEYEFKTDQESTLPTYLQVDTVFNYKDIICRNFTGSISDTLVEEGLRRYELKVFIQPPSDQRVIDVGNDFLVPSGVKIVNSRFRRTQRDKRALLYWILFGFFLGMVAELIVALTKKPSTK